MKQMTIEDRNRIEFLLQCGNTVPKIADELGRNPSTISREILNHRTASDKNYACSNRVCAHFDECTRRFFNGFSDRLRRNTTDCFRGCPDFREAVCPRLARPPFVCNGCASERNCPLRKRFYIPALAQAGHDETLSTARLGVRTDDERLGEMDDVLSPCLKKGQSVAAIMRGNADTFKGVKRSTVYGWIAGGRIFRAKTHDLPFAERAGARPKRAKPETKTNARCRVGRTIREMREWLKAHAAGVTCELDTVIGSVSGKALYTMIFPKTGLALAFLRNAKTAQTTTRLFNTLWNVAGPELFRRLFATILTDNGTEFSDPGMIESCRPDPEHNPTKLLPRGVRVWYCDPYCSSQKPHIERFHNDLRRIFQKGTSFDPLTQEKTALALSHLDSYPRESLGGRTPYDAFLAEYGEDGKRFLDALGIVRIPANEVTLHPFLLGEKYQKAADAAVLRKNGVTSGRSTPKKPESDK